jgi:hypothetical protein
MITAQFLADSNGAQEMDAFLAVEVLPGIATQLLLVNSHYFC